MRRFLATNDVYSLYIPKSHIAFLLTSVSFLWQMYLNCPGGSTYSVLGIYDCMSWVRVFVLFSPLNDEHLRLSSTISFLFSNIFGSDSLNDCLSFMFQSLKINTWHLDVFRGALMFVSLLRSPRRIFSC